MNKEETHSGVKTRGTMTFYYFLSNNPLTAKKVSGGGDGQIPPHTQLHDPSFKNVVLISTTVILLNILGQGFLILWYPPQSQVFFEESGGAGKIKQFRTTFIF